MSMQLSRFLLSLSLSSLYDQRVNEKKDEKEHLVWESGDVIALLPLSLSHSLS